jgi:hypothetical protein
MLQQNLAKNVHSDVLCGVTMSIAIPDDQRHPSLGRETFFQSVLKFEHPAFLQSYLKLPNSR